jgi:hypothetical protein
MEFSGIGRRLGDNSESPVANPNYINADDSSDIYSNNNDHKRQKCTEGSDCFFISYKTYSYSYISSLNIIISFH